MSSISYIVLIRWKDSFSFVSFIFFSKLIISFIVSLFLTSYPSTKYSIGFSNTLLISTMRFKLNFFLPLSTWLIKLTDTSIFSANCSWVSFFSALAFFIFFPITLDLLIHYSLTCFTSILFYCSLWCHSVYGALL